MADSARGQSSSHHRADLRRVRAAVVTVSDTRMLEDDAGGSLATALLVDAGHDVVMRVLVRDVPADIEGAIRQAIGVGAQLVVSTGGTGIAPRDVTYETVAGMLDKTLDGVGEAFRRLSWDEIGPRAVLSRAIGGTLAKTLVVALPGSPEGVRLGLERVALPIVGHAVGLLAKE